MGSKKPRTSKASKAAAPATPAKPSAAAETYGIPPALARFAALLGAREHHLAAGGDAALAAGALEASKGAFDLGRSPLPAVRRRH